jgi:hypothetical protein
MASARINTGIFTAQLGRHMSMARAIPSLPLRDRVTGILSNIGGTFEAMEERFRPRLAQALEPVVGMDDFEAFSRALVLMEPRLSNFGSLPAYLLDTEATGGYDAFARLAARTAEKVREQGEFRFISEDIPVLYRPGDVASPKHWASTALLKAFDAVKEVGWAECYPEVFKYTTSVVVEQLDQKSSEDPCLATATATTDARITLSPSEIDQNLDTWGAGLTEKERTTILSAIIVHEDRHNWQAATGFPQGLASAEDDYINLWEADAYLNEFTYLMSHYRRNNDPRLISPFRSWNRFFRPFLSDENIQVFLPDADLQRQKTLEGWRALNLMYMTSTVLAETEDKPKTQDP